MMKKIILYGYLKKLHKEPIEVEALSVAEAVRVLEQIPAFQGKHHPVRIDGVENEIQLYGKWPKDEIHIRPRTGGAGGKNSGLVQILIGVALIGLSLFLGPTGSLFGGFIQSSTLFTAGGLLITGGILQMLMKQPDSYDQEESSKYIGATGNTVKIGTPIPLILGTRRAFGHFLSLDVDAKIVTGTTPTGGTAQSPAPVASSTAVRQGLAPYDTGRFQYQIDRPTLPEYLVATNWYNNTGFTPFGIGRYNTIDPVGLYQLMTDGQLDRNFRATFKTTVTPQDTGTHTFTPTGPEAVAVGWRVVGGGAYTWTNSMTLTAGTDYDFAFVYQRTGALLPAAAVVFNLSITRPVGGTENYTVSPILPPIPGTPGTVPTGVVDISSGKYVVFDNTPLADGLSPVRPIFASQTRGPSNVPTSDWSLA